MLNLSERDRLERLTLFEKAAYLKGYSSIAGVDEAGRGPLAGPVVAVACILPFDLLIEGIDDSKQLTPSQRKALFEEITANPHICYALGVVDSARIDQINILQATLEAMKIAISQLKRTPDYILIDGNRLPPQKIPSEAIVRGDSRSQSIAAASIIAKQSRDEMMEGFHALWPQYGFDSHKGYGTRRHLAAIEQFGPSPIHRMSFKPFKI
ncbi:MAG: ribonuclease HII [Chlamydiales bacterium]|nr:ribonuclease HII [Chlamydiales bacterium]